MIRLSRLTDYAVTLLTQMVSEGKGVWSATDLGAKTGVPLPTVSKILKCLNKAGIVTAQRGATGGYRLARSGAEISIAMIVEAMDGPIALTDCAEGSAHSCHVEPICPMRGNWDKVNRAVRAALEEVSLADMASSSSPLAGEEAKSWACDSKLLDFAGEGLTDSTSHQRGPSSPAAQASLSPRILSRKGRGGVL